MPSTAGPQDELHGLICAVCGRVLFEARTDDGDLIGWMHANADLVDEDHPAVPVRRGTVPTRGRCDFCNGDEQIVILPVEPFEIPVPPELAARIPRQMSGDEWAACKDCAVFVAKRDWYRLLLRVRREQQARGDRHPPVVYEQMMAMFRAIDEHITGPLRPI